MSDDPNLIEQPDEYLAGPEPGVEYEDEPVTDNFGSGFLTGAAILGMVILLVYLLLSGPISIFAREKHTGPITALSGNPYEGYMFRRPNGEIFIAKFDDETLRFCGSLDDLTYTDAGHDKRHFVKAKLSGAK